MPRTNSSNKLVCSNGSDCHTLYGDATCFMAALGQIARTNYPVRMPPIFIPGVIPGSPLFIPGSPLFIPDDIPESADSGIISQPPPMLANQLCDSCRPGNLRRLRQPVYLLNQCCRHGNGQRHGSAFRVLYWLARSGPFPAIVFPRTLGACSTHQSLRSRTAAACRLLGPSMPGARPSSHPHRTCRSPTRSSTM